jgi:hypothetical protein
MSSRDSTHHHSGHHISVWNVDHLKPQWNKRPSIGPLICHGTWAWTIVKLCAHWWAGKNPYGEHKSYTWMRMRRASQTLEDTTGAWSSMGLWWDSLLQEVLTICWLKETTSTKSACLFWSASIGLCNAGPDDPTCGNLSRNSSTYRYDDSYFFRAESTQWDQRPGLDGSFTFIFYIQILNRLVDLLSALCKDKANLMGRNIFDRRDSGINLIEWMITLIAFT